MSTNKLNLMTISQQKSYLNNINASMDHLEMTIDGIERAGKWYPEEIRNQLSDLKKLYGHFEDEAMYCSIDLDYRISKED